MLRRWRPRPSGQVVTGSVVFGDVVQITDVGGDVTVNPSPRPYRVEPATAEATELTPDRARAQPSRLLLARYQVVPFTGRTRTLDDLDTWISGPDPVAARLVHAAGGQGKTRLAAEVARQCAAAGWTVWTVTHTATPVPGSRVELPGGALLAVVDYADRWPVSALQALLSQLRRLHARAGTTVRVLLLSRSSGFWWQAVAQQAESDSIETGSTALPALAADSDDDRLALFTTAASHFGKALHPAYPGPWPAPDLSGPGFAQVLAVHMAALAAVDAHRHGSEPPAHPHAISAYLLGREQAHWQELHARRESPLTTAPTVMQRATYVAVLTGSLPRPEARQALIQVALAGDPPTADQLIDDHKVCYPAADRRTVLEPLLPDRLAEDFLALATPGYDPSPLTDDWTLTAPESLFDSGDPRPWTPAAITTLVETAHRWRHIATDVLYPLVRSRPALVTAAGGATLTRLAAIPGIEPDVLAALEPHLPPDRHIDLDVAAAALTAQLTEHRLTHASDPITRGLHHSVYAIRLSNVGRYAEALDQNEKAIESFRDVLGDDHRALPGLADALNSAAIHLALLGHNERALVSATEAVTIFRRLASVDPDTYRRDLAMVLTNLSSRLAELGRSEEALPPAEEAANVYRKLAESGDERQLWFLAAALTNLSNRLAELGRHEQALPPAEEANRIDRRLADINPEVYLPELAKSLNNLAIRLAEVGRTSAARSPAEEGVGIYRRLARANPGSYRADLANSLLNLSRHQFLLGDGEQAVATVEESVAIRRALAQRNPGAYLPVLASSLLNLAVFRAGVGVPERGLSAVDEAIGYLEPMAERIPGVFAARLDGARRLRAEFARRARE
ncbi:tetratricopeptide repeat protein [Actinoplanes hulinensis]|uniref:Tetratricopeptide repeat protein n=1 Tax=Actinoplanes hulinensis TaxID=1144547 RepID=A0ABS7AYW0_9ACTN|nr:tetratricopeptide repeat protein [Actinoplanes hulinensis]MBW6433744.1 tetratricopeptide repeat protein [Actinoplanes hulinensis]